MRRTCWLVLTCLFALILSSVPIGAQGREVSLTTDALRVENLDGEQVWVLAQFRVESDEYTLRGETGRFLPRTERMYATGTPERPAVMTKAAGEDGDGAFTVTATSELNINFDDERLYARGSVTYVSDDTEAYSDILLVDDRDTVRSALAEFVDAIRAGESREIVLGFFNGLTSDARLVLLRGNVRVEREDATLRAAWMVFDESNPDSFISAAHPDQPLELRVLVGAGEN